MEKTPFKNFSQPQFVLLVVLLIQSGFAMAQQEWVSVMPAPVKTPPAAAIIAESFRVVGPAAKVTALPKELFRPVSTGGYAAVALVTTPVPAEKAAVHPFWDHKNRTLFALNGALAGTDFLVTRRNLGSNGKELNPVARMFAGSTPGLAANFALETGGVIGVSYLFHKTGHHTLERMTSYVNLGASAFAVSYCLAHH
jgi:hypothetical protein